MESHSWILCLYVAPNTQMHMRGGNTHGYTLAKSTHSWIILPSVLSDVSSLIAYGGGDMLRLNILKLHDWRQLGFFFFSKHTGTQTQWAGMKLKGSFSNNASVLSTSVCWLTGFHFRVTVRPRHNSAGGNRSRLFSCDNWVSRLEERKEQTE